MLADGGRFGSILGVPFVAAHSPPPFPLVTTSVHIAGGRGGQLCRSLDANYPAPPPPPHTLGGLWPAVSCQRCRPQESMGAKGARHQSRPKEIFVHFAAQHYPETQP